MPLVAVVLGEGDAGVDARLAGRDRHVRGVGDEDRPLHERAAAARVDERGELLEHLRHLVPPLAAADVDDDVGVRPLRQGVLQHGFARPEGAGEGGAAAAHDREEGVEHPLAGDQRPLRVEAGREGAGPAHGPALRQSDRMDRAIGVLHARHDVVVAELARVGDLDQAPRDAGRDEDPVADERGLGDLAQHLTGPDHVTDGRRRSEGPAPRRHPFGGAAAEVDALRLAHDLERPLDPVEGHADEAGPQRQREGQPGPLDRLARPEPRRLLIDLDGGETAVDRDHLGREALVAHQHVLEHAHRRLRPHPGDRPGDPVERPDAAHGAPPRSASISLRRRSRACARRPS